MTFTYHYWLPSNHLLQYPGKMILFLYCIYYQHFTKLFNSIILIAKKTRLQFQNYWYFAMVRDKIRIKVYANIQRRDYLKKLKVEASLFVTNVVCPRNNFNYVVIFVGIIHGLKFWRFDILWHMISNLLFDSILVK